MSSSHGRFIWYELTTTDVEAAKAFYTKVMGWGTREASMPGSRYTLFMTGDVSTGGLINLPQDAKARQLLTQAQTARAVLRAAQRIEDPDQPSLGL